jgi:hypothetical protein
MTFSSYTDAILSALKANLKFADIIARKQEILDGVYSTENLNPTSVLFIGFNPTILSCSADTIAVTEISDAAQQFLIGNNVKFTYIDPADLPNFQKKFQCVIAMDEYFTFAESEQDQQNKIFNICQLATDFVISTLRDYKNQDYKEREFSIPAQVRNGVTGQLFLESHEWDQKDRTHWNTMLYEVNRTTGNTISYGPFERRTMFFKQLAKFSMDAGAAHFLVHKNLMYKSLLKKNYEHVISIQFD